MTNDDFKYKCQLRDSLFSKIQNSQQNTIQKALLKNFAIYIYIYIYIYIIGIHSMQGWTATMRHGVTGKEAQKGFQDTENLFRKNLQLNDVC